MTDDLDLELDLGEQDAEKNGRIRGRINKLATEKAEALKKAEENAQAKALAEAKAQAAEKELGFYKGFNQVTSKYQGAGEFQDKIREKVFAGYDVEDATVAVLAKEGKLQTPTAPAPQKETVAGGSATNQPPQAEKGVGDMSQAERKAKLAEMLGS